MQDIHNLDQEGISRISTLCPHQKESIRPFWRHRFHLVPPFFPPSRSGTLAAVTKRVSAKVELGEKSQCDMFRKVSIPKRVSAKVEQGSQKVKKYYVMFQSLKGFQPKWNNHCHGCVCNDSAFQSLKGFQPKWNEWLNNYIPGQRSVSIPKRVSAKVERVNNNLRIIL